MPAATVKSAQSGAPSSNKWKLNGRKTPPSSVATTQPEVHDVRHGTALKLPKPLGSKAHRSITQKTSNLMRKRNELDRALLLQAFRPLDELSTNDWLPREELLRQCERTASREREHIQSMTKDLEEKTALYSQDPSQERVLDLNLIRTQLWKFKRHLGPYLETAEERKGHDEVNSSSESDCKSSDDESESVQDKSEDSASSNPSEDDAPNGNDDGEDPPITLDGAFDDIKNSKKRKRNEVGEARKEPQKVSRKEQASASTQSPTSRSKPGKADAPKRSKEMEASVSQIFNSMSQTKSSKASVNGASEAEAGKVPVEATTTNGTKKKPGRATSKTPASGMSSAPSDGDVRPWYQRHAKAMMRPDFDDCVREKPPHRCRPIPKKKRRQYLVSGAMPAPHLPSPRPDKAKARSASTDGP